MEGHQSLVSAAGWSWRELRRKNEEMLFNIIVLLFYFFPSLLAWRLGCKSALKIFLLNLFLGWTLLGWIGAVIWAAVERFGKKTLVQPTC